MFDFFFPKEIINNHIFSPQLHFWTVAHCYGEMKQKAHFAYAFTDMEMEACQKTGFISEIRALKLRYAWTQHSLTWYAFLVSFFLVVYLYYFTLFLASRILIQKWVINVPNK